ncbi:MAG: hypothetical protein JWP52_2871, partial [Rhizobacter sp.]|nr:hypothetical protein [Rhizobacter sp.]
MRLKHAPTLHRHNACKPLATNRRQTATYTGNPPPYPAESLSGALVLNSISPLSSASSSPALPDSMPLSRRLFGAAGLAALIGRSLPSAHAAGPATAPVTAPRALPIFVLNSLDANVSVIDPVSFTETHRLATGKEPHHLYLTPDEKSLMVANALGDSLTLIDPRTGAVQRTLTGIADPYQLRFSPDMKWFVTAGNRLNHVDLYRWEPAVESAPLKLVKRLGTGRTPSHLNIDSKSTVVYASVQDSDELCAIDLASQTTRWTIPVGKMPADVYLTADDRTLFL